MPAIVHFVMCFNYPATTGKNLNSADFSQEDIPSQPVDTTMDAGYVSPQDVAPIGFEMQTMEQSGVAPAHQTMYQDIQNQVMPSSYGDTGHRDSNANENGLSQKPEEVEDTEVSPDVLEITEASETSEDDTELLPEIIQGPEPSENKDLFFKDGVRRIDYVFAYPKEENAENEMLKKRQERRDIFEANLTKVGIELERDIVENGDKIVFVKIHAPWSVLAAQAEIINMKMPIAENDIAPSFQSCWSKIPSPFHYDSDILPPVPDYFSSPFSREREHQFIMKDRNSFFTPAQRSLIVHQILERCEFENLGDKSKNKFGIKRMVTSDSYAAAYPLHAGEYKSEHSLLTWGKANDRHLLYETWARPGAWYKFQPLDHIRKYFGEKIGIYFAWLGHYTSLLIIASVIGLIVFLYGCGTMLSDPTSQDVCNEGGAGNFTMCPECDKQCSYWKLKRSCLYSRVTYLFDNEATVFFAGFMALWVMVFHEMWQRRTAEIVYEWDVEDFEEEETIRPEFEASVRKRRPNPVTKVDEPYVSFGSRICRYASSLWVIVFMLLLVLAAVFGVICYRLTILALLYAVDDEYVKRLTPIITSITAALINLIIILILEKIYLVIAQVLTNFEHHRTQTEWEDSFTLKMFLFQFVNNYSSLFYIAFFKGRFVGRPGAYNRDISRRQEECDPAGCFVDLLIQLAIVMVGKQAFNNAKEIILPKLINWFKSRRVKEEMEKNKTVAQWEKDFRMTTMPDLGLFEEYLEMVVQFGFVTIFVAAFPLAPLFALINNIIEIRLDAYKFVTLWQRPLAERAQDIGIWFGILKGISAVAVASNACIIAFTSEFIPKLVFRHAFNNGSLEGYLNFSLSIFNVSNFEEESIPIDKKYETFGNVSFCRYRDFREPPGTPHEYEFTMNYWHILTARLAFIICFILVVVFLQWLIAFLVPDVPRAIKLQMLREKHLTKEYLLEMERSRREQLHTSNRTSVTFLESSRNHRFEARL